jgi:undecaprenyl-diphosphatase
MTVFWGLGIALLGVISGLSWRMDWARKLDQTLFLKLNSPDQWVGLDRWIRYFRWFGTNWALVVYVAIIVLWQYRLGITLIVAALITSALEMGIKRMIKRPRPFSSLPTAILRQNPVPLDTGFPSGDATRIWFIFATLTIGLSPPLGIILGIGLCALFVSFGRVRLGVHYPLDVWAGSSLGFGLGLMWTAFLPI